MSITWGDSVRNHDRKQGAGSVSSITGGQPPAALSQNPLTDGRFGAEQPLARDNGRPAFEISFWDYVYYVLWIATFAVGTGLLIVLFNFWKLGIL